MASVAAQPSFVASRRRLLSSLFASAGFASDPSLAMRRAGRTGSRDASIPVAPDSATAPPAAIRWLTRGTFGFTIADFLAFNALGASDDARWTAWIARQLAPSSIDDSACDARLAGAGFVTLGKSANQLWNDHHETDDYYVRMLPVAECECATLMRQIYSQRQLYEVIVDFWHDHFSVFGWDYDGGPMFVAMDRDAIRPHAFGNFRTMLQAAGESASMMYMLDLYASEAGHPNENYARELMELHTLGAENYAGIVRNPDSPANLALLGTFTAWDGEIERLKYVDDDVYEAARALTGWTISGSTWPYDPIGAAPLGTFAYDDGNHDQAPKHILARYMDAYQGEADGTLLFDMLAQHPGTAHFVATKLCRRFVGDHPSATLVASVADVLHAQWQAPDQIAQALSLLLQSTDLKQSWGTKMKRPAMAAVGALRATGASFTLKTDDTGTWTTTEEFVSRLQAAGHRLFYWPAPNGYPDVIEAWSSTGAMGMTLKLLPRLLEMHQNQGYDNTQPFVADVQAQTLAAFPDPDDRTATNLVGYWCDRILGYRPEPTHAIALDFLRQNAGADDALDLVADATNDQGQPQHTGTWNLNDLSKHYTIARLRTAIALILCAPEFLRR
ncbi:MAG TPA: DUF1800 domain-containing protein [Rhodanobacteraceae bacterium]|nr:DUF1800 domain-containing protein [Rhodanobacteraceae bacterium]